MTATLVIYDSEDAPIAPEVVEPLTETVQARNDHLDTKADSDDSKPPGAALPPRAPSAPTTPDSLARRAWHMLGDTTHRCDTFDYFPNGGIYNFFCHLKDVVSQEDVEDLITIDIFVSGPHESGLDRSSTHDFGRYNPEFVRKLPEWTLPALHNEAFQESTQPAYNQFVAPLARTYWATYIKLNENQDLWDSETSKLKERLESQDGVSSQFYERYFFFMNPKFSENPDAGFELFDDGFDGHVYNGNVVKSAVGFWLRRRIDGTADDFKDGLRKLLELYDEDFLNDPPREYRKAP